MNENRQNQSGSFFDYADWFFQNEDRKKREKKEIRRLGFFTGTAILLMILFQNIIDITLQIFGLYNHYRTNLQFQTGLDIIISVVSILLPFLIVSIPMKKRTGIETVAPLEKSKDTKLSLLGIVAGLGLCMLADIVTGYITVFIRGFGFELSSPDMSNPTGTAGFMLSVVRAVIVAAAVEEISLRGCVMQPLRKYGDNFAIIMSACAFGLMHCNLIQAPFALIVGLGLGYIAIKTESLWPAIIVHALNNFISTAVSYLLDKNINEQMLNLLYSAIIYGLMIAGFIALLFFSRRAKIVSPSRPENSALSFPQKAFAYITNPTMIIAIIIMLYITSKYVKMV